MVMPFVAKTDGFRLSAYAGWVNRGLQTPPFITAKPGCRKF